MSEIEYDFKTERICPRCKSTMPFGIPTNIITTLGELRAQVWHCKNCDEISLSAFKKIEKEAEKR